ISVHYAVVVAIGPDRAGETADGSADHRALEDADARKDRTGSSAKRRAAESASHDRMRGRIIALGGTRIILAVLDIAVDIAVVLVVGPYRTGEAADRCADRGALDRADARCDRTDH